ncbi:hypothetical protein E2542_SST04460 [Spatholobus suberectus]|nr:hypothetical protein E2542_SST04460 [Spatholobus suberectus]
MAVVLFFILEETNSHSCDSYLFCGYIVANVYLSHYASLLSIHQWQPSRSLLIQCNNRCATPHCPVRGTLKKNAVTIYKVPFKGFIQPCNVNSDKQKAARGK